MPVQPPKPIRLLIQHSGGKPPKNFVLHETRVSLDAPVTAGWSVAPMETTGDGVTAWEFAYEAVRAKKAAYIEPDLETGFWAPPPAEGARRFAGSSGSDRGLANEQNPKLAIGQGFAWHLSDEYTGLATARRMANEGNPSAVRVAIFDVGFDLNHQAIPPHLNLELARNFIEDGRAGNDVSDPGAFGNPGHGTGTLSILASGQLPDNMLPEIAAGKTLGAVPEANIVPIRIAESVVLLQTSAFAAALEYCIALNQAGQTPIDVISMSMGGVASRLWAGVVNRAYEAGITIVAAAGNTKIVPLKIVYPARFGRVIAACGAMANHRPYRDVPIGYMFGCYGPESKMTTAIAGFTPNIPWAESGSPLVIDLDGQGTSSATPQVAAAAALWLRKHKRELSGQPGWKVVEAVRHALFTTADTTFEEYSKYFGNGILKAHRAMDIPADLTRPICSSDEVSMPIAKIIFGVAPEAEMAEVELAQLAQQDPRVDTAIDCQQERELKSAIIDSPAASATLKKLARKGYKSTNKSQAGTARIETAVPNLAPTSVELPQPEYRRLQAFAYDPLLAGDSNSFEFNRATMKVPWESLDPGPTGEYLEVIDVDPPSNCFYEPVKLDDPRLLATDGFAPSIGNPQFHQQMVYTVAMRTVHRFEMGLGRRVMWSPRMKGGSEKDGDFVQRLRIHPHALFEENAYYDPTKKALLFGYFAARPTDAASVYRGGMTFSCLSHDIIAHETTHAILDGVYREFGTRTNPDQLAFHEAFADLVAMFQHFRIREALTAVIRDNAGKLNKASVLLDLAQEFGKATGMHGALRSALDTKPSPEDYNNATGAHARGAVLVAAVFAAFTEVYQRQTADLFRIATQGSGVLPPGAIHPDLVNRLAAAAAGIAENFLDICIRALDYCPPTDLDFGDYLRAMITADYDLVREDPNGYRVAIIEAFRERGIYPAYLRALSEDTLLWRRPQVAFDQFFRQVPSILASFAGDLAHMDPGPGRLAIPAKNARERVFERTRWARAELHRAISAAFAEMPPEERTVVARELGLKVTDDKVRFQVHTLFLADRSGPNGKVLKQFVISLLQSHDYPGVKLKSGCTLLVERSSYEVRYAIRKGAENQERLGRNFTFALQSLAAQSTYFKPPEGNNFAALHAGVEEEAYG